MNAKPSFFQTAADITGHTVQLPRDALTAQLIRINRKERALGRAAVAAADVGGERAAHAVLMAHVCREMGV